ncbi:dienelactone hydrolase family protein [Streptomyces sp. LMG1-1-1.1]|uniref:dienelactone hydrolase family protein n=1 Tax=Streptomyces sp. LMG1-1-1.1 TaxID=3135245 RepID=UPI003467CE50
MTAFVLVSGPFTGGWVWEETAARLRAAGAEPYPVTLTGMGERKGEAGPATGLETHVEDLVGLIDGVDAREVVLVGHGYALHPVFGAADRRPERVVRIVAVDTGLPEDGRPAVGSVPDPEVRERLGYGTGDGAVGDDGDGGRAGARGPVPPPTRGSWRRWGSTEGIPADALERLERLAVPQPAATLTQPLRLTGAVAALPVTGVLCTANGSDIAMVEMLVASGPPQFRALADDRVRFFELATGHWPMLSAPGELADVLLRAAAGEGHRVTAPEGAHAQPSHLLPFLMDLPEVPRERRGRIDLHFPADTGDFPADEGHGPAGAGHVPVDDGDAPAAGTVNVLADTRYVPADDGDLPADDGDLPAGDGDLPARGRRPLPAVVFVHGGPVAAGQRPTPRDTPFFLGYGRYAASRGVVGVTLDHRLHGIGDCPIAAEDLAEAVERVRADPRVDGERIGLWFFSTGGLLAADWLAAPEPWLRCVALSYPALAPLPGWEAVEPRFRPVEAVGTAGGPPVVLTRAGREHPVIAATVREFLDAAGRSGADVEVVDVLEGRHGFELVDPTDDSRAAVARAMDAVLDRLGAGTGTGSGIVTGDDVVDGGTAQPGR